MDDTSGLGELRVHYRDETLQIAMVGILQG